MRQRHSNPPQVVLSPSGDVFVESSSIYSDEECAKMIRSGSAITFVKLTPRETASFRKALDNALAEVIARIGGARHRANRR